MRQLHIREPWAHLGYESEQQVLNDLTIRIQMLETRLRQLEATVADRSESQVREGVEPEPVGVRG
jgi:hypothetical protein